MSRAPSLPECEGTTLNECCLNGNMDNVCLSEQHQFRELDAVQSFCSDNFFSNCVNEDLMQSIFEERQMEHDALWHSSSESDVWREY